MYRVEKTHWWFAARRLFIETIVKQYVALSRPFRLRRVADIGAGTGGMIPFLSRYGDVTGIEINGAARSLAKKRNVHLRKGTAHHTGLSSGRFDMVTFFDVLYHKGIDESLALQEAYRLLRTDGVLVVTDSAFEFLSGPHDRAVEGKTRYTSKELREHIERAGFTVLYSGYLFAWVFPVLALKRIVDRHVKKNQSISDVVPVAGWINRLAYAICMCEAVGLRYGSYPFGTSVCVVAYKRGT